MRTDNADCKSQPGESAQAPQISQEPGKDDYDVTWGEFPGGAGELIVRYRMADLMHKRRSGTISEEEKAELVSLKEFPFEKRAGELVRKEYLTGLTLDEEAELTAAREFPPENQEDRDLVKREVLGCLTEKEQWLLMAHREFTGGSIAARILAEKQAAGKIKKDEWAELVGHREFRQTGCVAQEKGPHLVKKDLLGLITLEEKAALYAFREFPFDDQGSKRELTAKEMLGKLTGKEKQLLALYRQYPNADASVVDYMRHKDYRGATTEEKEAFKKVRFDKRRGQKSSHGL